MIGMDMLLEEHPDKKVHVFNSRSASIGETLIGMKIEECEKAGLSFEETVKKVEHYISEQHTFFVLENLDTLRKNGRLSKMKAFVASALKIKPVMASTDEGSICQVDQARGMNKALVKMAEHVMAKTGSGEGKVLAISHCNCEQRAILLKEALEEKMHFARVVILDTAGVSSLYANDGGVIVVA
jgi:DegV family protein with EDD domain